MPSMPRPTALAAALFLAAGSAAGVPLSPGDSVLVRDTFDATLLVPGVALVGDPSLAGSVVADTLRSFSFVVTTHFASSPDVSTSILTGTVRDWVVRRDDTGTLDFYTQVMLPPPSLFGGTIMRPWRMEGAASIDAAWRDDASPAGNPPTRLSLAADGQSVGLQYFVTDEGAPNWIQGDPSAPVLFRSGATAFGTGWGSIQFSYGTEFSSSGGGQALAFYVPGVPEPSAAWLLAAGLVGVAAVAGRRRR